MSTPKIAECPGCSNFARCVATMTCHRTYHLDGCSKSAWQNGRCSCGLYVGEQPAPVSATELERRTYDPVRALISLPCHVCGKEERERPMTLSDKWRHEDPNDCIGTLRARLAEAERATEEQVERNRVEIMDRDAFITFEEATAKARAALTAARGGG